MRLPFTIFLILFCTLANAQKVDSRWYRSDAIVDSVQDPKFRGVPSVFICLIDTSSALEIMKTYEKDEYKRYDYIPRVGLICKNSYVHSVCLNILSEARGNDISGKPQTYIDEKVVLALAFQNNIADTFLLKKEFDYWMSRMIKKENDWAWENAIMVAYLLKKFGVVVPVTETDFRKSPSELLTMNDIVNGAKLRRQEGDIQILTLHHKYSSLRKIDIDKEPQLKQFLIQFMKGREPYVFAFTYNADMALADISDGSEITQKYLLKFSPPATIECERIYNWVYY